MTQSQNQYLSLHGFVLSPLSVKNIWEIMVIRIKKPNCVVFVELLSDGAI